MKLIEEELPGGVTKVTLEGRLDVEGAAAVDLKMSLIANTRTLSWIFEVYLFSHRLDFGRW